jgi:phytoene dehydrogenase-like protein
MPDAVVIGAGHNGLVAANLLADAGWDVTVLEAAGEAGGSVRTAELTAPGFANDVFSAFYPLVLPRRSCAACGWRSTGCSGCTPPWRSPTRRPTAAARCCRAT